MSRIRSLHPEICESESLAKVSAGAERTLVRLWTHCDDEGRCKGNPTLLRSRLYPMHEKVTAEMVAKDLKELATNELIVLYGVDDVEYLAVPTKAWRKWQKPQHPQKSKLPAPPNLPVLTASEEADIHRETGVGVNAFEADFAICWEQYPRKVDRTPAFRAYQARRREGVSAEDLLAATRNYAAKRKGKDQEFTKHGKTFFGPDWKEHLDGGAAAEEDTSWHGIDEQDRSIWDLGDEAVAAVVG